MNPDGHRSSLAEKSSRRNLLALLAAGGAAAATTLLPRNGVRAGHDGSNSFHLGEDNSTQAPTTLAAQIPTDHDPDPHALTVFIPQGRALSGNSSLGVGVSGHSENGAEPENPPVGVEGTAHNDGIGVRGESKAGEGEGPGAGPGVVGSSGSGPGVEGSSESGAGLAGHSDSGNAVEAHSNTGFGVVGHSENLVGAGGFSVTDLGVLGIGGAPPESGGEGDGVGGFSFNSVGGRFVSFNGIGVRAVSPGDDHPALQAASGEPTDPHAEADPDGGLALEVIGKARFSTAGSGTVLEGQNSVHVANAAVTGNSHITVTLASDPGARQILWVERNPGLGFIVHLTSAPPPQRPEVAFTYLIVEPTL